MCPNLEILSCADNCLTSAALKIMSQFKNLKQLYLQGNFIGDEGLATVLESTSLRYANLSKNIIFQQVLNGGNP